jgi:hypothetical protein
MATHLDTPIDPESIDGSFLPRRDASVQIVAVDGEAILVDRGSGLHLLNPTAFLLWQCFDGEVTLAELADEISTEMGVPSDEVLTHTISVAQEFAVRRVLVDGRTPTVEASEPPVPSDALEAREVPEPGTTPRVLADPPNA